MRIWRFAKGIILLPAFLLVGCEVGPNYHPPSAPVPARYTELSGWARAAPAATLPKGDWWVGFGDPELDQLEPEVAISNQTVRADYYRWQEARDLVQEARSQLFPSVGLLGSAVRSQTSQIMAANAAVSGSASWELDLWGGIRREIEQTAAVAQESQATLANATLSEQALLATNLIDFRVADAEIELLKRTVQAYRASLRVTENQAAAGVASPSDVITARAQLEGARSSLINAGIARAEYRHAIAVLVGRLPEALSAPPATTLPKLPEIPVGVPSTLLERRPDIAADERAVAAANAAIGIQIAAFYPTITLTASAGYSGSPIDTLFSVANQVWSLGTDAALGLFEGGARSAAVNAAKASYKAAVATYRTDVLAAFQQVEDDLASLRILARQQVLQDATVRDAARAVQIALNEYEAGTQAYTTVVTAQTTLLADQETDLAVSQSRLLASVDLIEALGGGWSAHELSDAEEPPRGAGR